MTETKLPAPSGWIILDKPHGLGSTQAVAAVKRNLREGGYAKTKVGHGGTLDPLAEGVLPIALGEATKLAGRMLDASKMYAFTVRFGEETDTLDSEGEIIERSDIRPSLAEVEAIIPDFLGAIDQVPPAYSSLKVDGKRAYQRARKGEQVDMSGKLRSVTIHHLGRVSRDREDDRWGIVWLDGFRGEQIDEINFVADVSKGTYIRSLARDIALAVGTVGHVTFLRRMRAGPFHPAQAISLDKLNEIGKGAPLEDVMLPLEAGLDDIPALTLTSNEAAAVRQGRVLTGQPQADGLYCAMHRETPVALVELESGTAKVVRGFNLPDVAE